MPPNAQGLCCTPRSAPVPRQSPPTWARLPSHAPMFPASEHAAVGEFQMQPLTPSLQRRVCESTKDMASTVTGKTDRRDSCFSPLF